MRTWTVKSWLLVTIFAVISSQNAFAANDLVKWRYPRTCEQTLQDQLRDLAEWKIESRTMTGEYTAIQGGWTTTEAPGVKPTNTYLSYTLNPSNHHAFLHFQLYEFHALVNRESMMMGTVTADFDHLDGNSLPPFRNLADGDVIRTVESRAEEWQAHSREGRYSIKPGEKLGWLRMEMVDGHYSADPNSYDPIERKFKGFNAAHQDVIVLDIQVSPDLKTFGQVRYRHDRRTPVMAKLPRGATHETVVQWSPFQHLSDVTVSNWIPHVGSGSLPPEADLNRFRAQRNERRTFEEVQRREEARRRREWAEQQQPKPQWRPQPGPRALPPPRLLIGN